MEADRAKERSHGPNDEQTFLIVGASTIAENLNIDDGRQILHGIRLPLLWRGSVLRRGGRGTRGG